MAVPGPTAVWRSRRDDHFDEGGVVVVSSVPSADAVWRWLRGEKLCSGSARRPCIRALRCFVLGTRPYEQLLPAFKGMTATGRADEVAKPLAALLVAAPHSGDIDQRLAGEWRPDITKVQPRVFPALPLLALAGVTPASGKRPSDYDDCWQFRPGAPAQRIIARGSRPGSRWATGWFENLRARRGNPQAPQSRMRLTNGAAQ
ncbi:DUF3025 domain-containing protein [Candidatus Accumulibacter sp. ACC003]|uniref:DUF3025 domain-containing protein n=1 Tax=Candidatus Accumulibacter sp. ACC003 TaxID=2823334 RepID=UPI0034507040